MKLTAAQRAQSFRCVPLHSTVTRGVCAARHEHYKATVTYSSVRSGGSGVASCACRGCPVGGAHARGELAPVALVQVRCQALPYAPPVKRCQGCGEPLPPAPPRLPGTPSYPRYVHGKACWALLREFRRNQHMERLGA
jgi:hypothetical protein